MMYEQLYRYSSAQKLMFSALTYLRPVPIHRKCSSNEAHTASLHTTETTLHPHASIPASCISAKRTVTIKDPSSAQILSRPFPRDSPPFANLYTLCNHSIRILPRRHLRNWNAKKHSRSDNKNEQRRQVYWARRRRVPRRSSSRPAGVWAPSCEEVRLGSDVAGIWRKVAKGLRFSTVHAS